MIACGCTCLADVEGASAASPVARTTKGCSRLSRALRQALPVQRGVPVGSRSQALRRRHTSARTVCRADTLSWGVVAIRPSAAVCGGCRGVAIAGHRVTRPLHSRVPSAAVCPAVHRRRPAPRAVGRAGAWRRHTAGTVAVPRAIVGQGRVRCAAADNRVACPQGACVVLAIRQVKDPLTSDFHAASGPTRADCSALVSNVLPCAFAGPGAVVGEGGRRH